MASANCHRETVRALLDTAADIVRQNKRGKTALNLAEDAGHAEIARLLVEAHAGPGFPEPQAKCLKRSAARYSALFAQTTSTQTTVEARASWQEDVTW